ncbi:hypothetical protein V6U90_33045 [Micromonospora sp. CPCC 206060]|uniref:hypothetical protein n=1 Tax=Micromonospora sp. CPCC 206060 TaxID=3122406 RepID=UPI002FF1A234
MIAGDDPVLVHNCGTGSISKKLMDEHILARHDENAPEAFTTWKEKSKFESWVKPKRIRNWAKLAMRKPIDGTNVGTGSAHRHILDIGSVHPVGYDKNGDDLFSIAVWVKDGVVESVHPI